MRDLNDLAILARVAERLSFEAAARDLGLSASTVSRRIAALEARLNVQLVRRTTRSVKLTPAGAEYASHCKAMIVAAERAEALARTHVEGMQGELIVNAPTLFGRLVLSPVITAFAARHPDVRVKLSLSNNRIDLEANNVDLVIRTGTLPDSSLRARGLLMAPLAIVASTSCLSRHGTPTTLAQIAALPCLGLDRGGDTRWHCGALTEPVAVDARFVADDNEILRDAALAGLGFALLPRFAVQPALRDGRLTALSLDVDPGSAPVSIIFPGHKVPNRCATALADTLIAHVKDDPAWRTTPARPAKQR